MSEMTTPTRPIDALLRAARLAAEGRGVGLSVLRVAPSHTGAYLLSALDAIGWQLVPKDDVERLRTLGQELHDAMADLPESGAETEAQTARAAAAMHHWSVAHAERP